MIKIQEYNRKNATIVQQKMRLANRCLYYQAQLKKSAHGVGTPIKRAGRWILSFFPERVKQELAAIDSPFVDAAR
jgi:hypothetical protein